MYVHLSIMPTPEICTIIICQLKYTVIKVLLMKLSPPLQLNVTGLVDSLVKKEVRWWPLILETWRHCGDWDDCPMTGHLCGMPEALALILFLALPKIINN